MVAHIGIGGGAGNGERRTEGNALAIAVFGRGPVTNPPGAAVQTAHRKRFSLPLLPRQLLAFHEISAALTT